MREPVKSVFAIREPASYWVSVREVKTGVSIEQAIASSPAPSRDCQRRGGGLQKGPSDQTMTRFRPDDAVQPGARDSGEAGATLR
jgi:hypothetical protein